MLYQHKVVVSNLIINQEEKESLLSLWHFFECKSLALESGGIKTQTHILCKLHRQTMRDSRAILRYVRCNRLGDKAFKIVFR